MAALKYSRQREAIKEFLAGRCDHPTADVVYENLRESYPNLSLGTVYRNLALLSSIGEIRKLTAGDGKEHFDGNAMPHNHFLCKECGKILDLEVDDAGYDARAQESDFKGRIDGHSTIFYGVCPDCLPRMKKTDS